MSHVCALQLVSVYMQTSVAIHSARLAVGNYAAVPWMESLFRLMMYIRLGVCGETKVLEHAEMPDLQPLIDQLPLPWRVRLEMAIKEELAGQTGHVSPEITELTAELLVTGQMGPGLWVGRTPPPLAEHLA